MIVMSLNLLLVLCINEVYAEINRADGSLNSFSVINQGRLNFLTTLMHFKDITLDECFNNCIMHLSCQSVSFSSSEKLCELNDMEFDSMEAETGAVGWVNYGTPPKVNGGFSEWRNLTSCSSTCGKGYMRYHRSCDNPIPQQGGADCTGDEIKTEPCFIQDCPVCYGARNDEFGSFTVNRSGALKSIRLIHHSGKVYCTKNSGARWGCPRNDKLTVVITEKDRSVIFPGIYQQTEYSIPGIDLNGDEIVLTGKIPPVSVREGDILRIWDGHDLSNHYEGNNSGRHCVYVQLIYDE